MRTHNIDFDSDMVELESPGAYITIDIINSSESENPVVEIESWEDVYEGTPEEVADFFERVADWIRHRSTKKRLEVREKRGQELD